MFLSCLEISTARSEGRMWLENPYRAHQRIMQAFPDGEAERTLFRLEGDHQPPRLLVQSPKEANWEAAFNDLPILRRAQP